MAIQSESGRACPFARVRKRWRAAEWDLPSYYSNPIPEPADTGLCGDWCQLFDDDTHDCRLVQEE